MVELKTSQLLARLINSHTKGLFTIVSVTNATCSLFIKTTRQAKKKKMSETEQTKQAYILIYEMDIGIFTLTT